MGGSESTRLGNTAEVCAAAITWRMPSAMAGAIASHASSVMYPVGVMTIVDPGGAPCSTRNLSVYPALRCFPARWRGRGSWRGKSVEAAAGREALEAAAGREALGAGEQCTWWEKASRSGRTSC
eukprot:466522-Prymnesium_polylepis.1